MKTKHYKPIKNRETGETELVSYKVQTQHRFRVLDRTTRVLDFIVELFDLDIQADEYVYMIALDTKCHPIGVFEMAHGGDDTCPFPVREIFSRALMADAHRIVLVHNHPTGDPAPSEFDRDDTKRCIEAGWILGCPLTDHIIVGSGGQAYSFYGDEPELWL